MSIDWIGFTPINATIGGLMIGLAAGGLILFNGRIAGISGIVGGILSARRGEIGWRVAFLAGLIAAPMIYRLAAPIPAARIDASWLVLIVAGLAVGLGTRYGSGCTSGHGVCGLSRLSPRSLVAVVTFIATGFVTVFITRHILGG